MYKYLLLLLPLLVMCFFSSCNNQSTDGREVKHVIVIGIDGLSPDGILHSPTPNIDFLMDNGAYTFHARAVLPTSSSPNWASMIMGAGPEQHGITSNSWERDEHILTPATTGDDEIFPTIFGVIRNNMPHAEIGAIYHWEGFGRLFEKKTLSYDAVGQDEEDTANKAAAYIENGKPLFTFIHFDHVDHAGHHDGHGTPAYYAAVSRADSLLGRIIEATKAADTFEETVFIVTSDHGGVGKGHGGESLAEIEIPFILFGKNVKRGLEILQPVYTYDNAATVAFLLGIDQPYAWIGKPIKSAFEGYEGPEFPPKKSFLTAPRILPEAEFYAAAGGLFVDQEVQVEIMAAEKGDEIYYTVDGSVPGPDTPKYKGAFKVSKSTVVKAKAFNNKQESQIAEGYFRLVKSNNNNGVQYTYYEGDNWIKLPALEKLSSLNEGRTYEFRIDSLATRESGIALKYEALLEINEPGTYTFYTFSDDGSRLLVGNEEVVDNDGDHGAIEKSGKIALEAGRHPITVYYFNGGGGGWLDVFYKGPGVPKQIIPADKLFLPELRAAKL